MVSMSFQLLMPFASLNKLNGLNESKVLSNFMWPPDYLIRATSNRPVHFSTVLEQMQKTFYFCQLQTLSQYIIRSTRESWKSLMFFAMRRNVILILQGHDSTNTLSKKVNQQKTTLQLFTSLQTVASTKTLKRKCFETISL